jgi:nucleotide-binding universal stress UspA family protein
MFRHILVPLDGSKLAESALPVAAYLSRILAAKVTLLHVLERDAPAEIHGDRHIRAAEEADAYLRQSSLVFSERVPVATRIEAGEASGVSRRIQDCAAAIGIDLILMCTHGHSGFRHLLLGSNALQVVAAGSIPVLQVRPSQEAGREYSVGRLLAPLDGKPEHEQGLRVSVSLAQACGADVQALGVVPTPRTLRGEGAAAARLSPGTASAMLEIALKETAEYLQSRIAVLGASGVRVAAAVERGDPSEEILRTAERTHTDLIVVATHRKAGTEAFWRGSVAPRVAQRSIIPILLLPLSE